MTKRKVTSEEYDTICEMLNQLTEILLVVGIVELKISKKEREIFWDTEGGGKIDPAALDKFSSLIDRHYMDIAMGTKDKGYLGTVEWKSWKVDLVQSDEDD